MKTLSAVALASVILASNALPVDAQEATLTLQKSEEYGEYIADADRRALYMFEADTQGKGGSEAVSACKDDCAGAWPPLVTEGPTQVSEGIIGDLIGTLERDDGTMQVTYNGWPLYYFIKDENPGDTTGHDVEGFGAEWYLLTPGGEKAHD